MKNLVFLLMFVVSFSSCREKSQLEMDVMKIHDEVMPKMGKLNKTRIKLSKLLKNMEDGAQKTAILDAIKALEAADDGMMDWMSDYSVPSDADERVKYLNDQMMKIQKVKDDMLAAMKEGEALLISKK